MAFSYKAKTFRTTAFFPLFQHTAFYFPPGRLLWPSADHQMVQTIRPEAFAASFQTKKLRTFAYFPLFTQHLHTFPYLHIEESMMSRRLVDLERQLSFICLYEGKYKDVAHC